MRSESGLLLGLLSSVGTENDFEFEAGKDKRCSTCGLFLGPRARLSLCKKIKAHLVTSKGIAPHFVYHYHEYV